MACDSGRVKRIRFSWSNFSTTTCAACLERSGSVPTDRISSSSASEPLTTCSDRRGDSERGISKIFAEGAPRSPVSAGRRQAGCRTRRAPSPRGSGAPPRSRTSASPPQFRGQTPVNQRNVRQMTSRALSFGAAATSYERFRLGYPDAVGDLIMAYADPPCTGCWRWAQERARPPGCSPGAGSWSLRASRTPRCWPC